MASLPRRIFSRSSYAETLRVGEVLRRETTGGLLLITAAVIALIWANSPASATYFGLRDLTVGPEALHLNLSLGAWAADGLLALRAWLTAHPEVRCVAVPPLGCGLGGLDWDAVYPMVRAALGDLPQDVVVYAPRGWKP